jgi:hypothetical protein
MFASSVQVVQAELYDKKKKTSFVRIITGKAFKKINGAKVAWKAFRNEPSCAKKAQLGPISRPLLVPSSLPPPEDPFFAPRRLRRAEKSATFFSLFFFSNRFVLLISLSSLLSLSQVLSERTQRIILVMERCYNNYNQQVGDLVLCLYS